MYLKFKNINNYKYNNKHYSKLIILLILLCIKIIIKFIKLMKGRNNIIE